MRSTATATRFAMVEVQAYDVAVVGLDAVGSAGTESRGARADTTGWRATVGQGGKPPRLMDTFASYMYTC